MLRRLALLVVVSVGGCGAKSQLREVARPSLAPDVDAAVAQDGGLDASMPVDASVEADAGRDGGADAGVRADAGTDAGRDTGTDTGTDTGADAAVVDSTIGCADEEREGFRDLARYPRIAGCAGGWTRPGVVHPAPLACAGLGGDDGPFPDGGACGVADLCAVGWHVCTGPSDVRASSPDGCDGSHDAPSAFFASRMSSSGCGVCATGTVLGCSAVDCRAECAQTATTTNDVFGCGTVGAIPDAASCGPLDRFGHNLCSELPAPWSCSDDGSGTHEAELVVKPGSAHGGVLCCRE